jgi:hypothetical protein
MAERESHSVRNGVIGTVLGGIALAALGELWPPFKGALSWLWETVVAFFSLLGASYATPGWVLAALGLLALVTVIRILVEFRSSGSAGPSYINYVEDVLFGAKWRWQWFGHEIKGLWCFCPRCDGELVYDDSPTQNFYSPERASTRFICEHCQHTEIARLGGDKEYALDSVRREIRRRARTGQFAGVASDG